MKSKLRGLVLSGGKSSRLGVPKAHIFIDKIPQWQRAEQVLSAVCSQVYFSVSPDFCDVPVSDNRLIFDDQALGPLGGILSAFNKYHAPWLILACDMPKFSEQAARFLLAQRNPHKLASVFSNSTSQIEPLCAIYEPAIFEHLLAAKNQQILCPRQILSALPVELVAAVDQSWFDNINYPTDLVSHKKISLQFYASLREEAGVDEMEVFSEAASVIELFREIKQRLSLSIDENSLRFARNEYLVIGHESIASNDCIVFIPPVSGG